MSIRIKLTLMVALSACAIVLLALINFTQSSFLKADAARITEQVVPGISEIGQVEYAFARARYDVVYHIIQFDTDEKAATEKRFNEHIKQLKENLGKLESSIADETDRANVTALKGEIETWMPLTLKILERSNSGDPEGALTQIREHCVPQAERIYQALAKAEAYKQTLSTQASDAITGDISNARAYTIWGGLALLVAIAVTGWRVGGGIIKPLNQMQHFAEELAREYDFTRRVEVTSRDETGQSIAAINRLLDTLQGSLKQLQQVGHDVTRSVSSLSATSRAMSENAESVSESASAMAAGIEEVTVSVNHVADRATECDQSARSAGDYARHGGHVIDETIAKINAIHHQARDSAERIDALQQQAADIGTVVATIKDIADQTNLLALNAAIEAARAGEQGRGFAVVADEVRKLAERTSQSTQQITATISAIQQEAGAAVASMQQMVTQVDAGVDAARVASTAIGDIRRSTDEVVGQISEISHAMREQSAASTTMATQVEHVASMSERSNASAQSTAGDAARLSDLGRALDAAVARYRV
ncbi:methyl-accepting chemotaxis protein [Chitinibacteraceae bacterium HSL-7]